MAKKNVLEGTDKVLVLPIEGIDKMSIEELRETIATVTAEAVESRVKIVLIVGERDSLMEQLAGVEGHRDGLLETIDTLMKERDEAVTELSLLRESAATMDAQIDHLKEQLQKAPKLIESVELKPLFGMLPPADPVEDLKETLRKHQEHKVVYVKENGAFSFREPKGKDAASWSKVTRATVLGEPENEPTE